MELKEFIEEDFQVGQEWFLEHITGDKFRMKIIQIHPHKITFDCLFVNDQCNPENINYAASVSSINYFIKTGDWVSFYKLHKYTKNEVKEICNNLDWR